MSRIGRWFEILGRRSRACRITRPPLHAFYWTGAPSVPREVRDISRTGAFIVTEDQLYPGTVMHMILQRANGTDEHPKGAGYFGIWAKVVRCADPGLGVQFLWGDNRERRGLQHFIDRIREKAPKEKMSQATSDTATPAEDQMQSEMPAHGDEAADAGCEPGRESVQIAPSTGDAPASDPAPNSAYTSAPSGEPAPANGGKPPQIRDNRAGSTLIEFAFVLLPLLAILFGAIEMDRMLLTYNAIANSARSAVRYAAVHGEHNAAGKDSVIQLARNFAAMGLLDPSKVTVDVKWTDYASNVVADTAAKPVGTRISVAVSYPYDPLTSFFPLSVTLRSASKGVVAF